MKIIENTLVTFTTTIFINSDEELELFISKIEKYCICRILRERLNRNCIELYVETTLDGIVSIKKIFNEES